jgi:hypothetical protein
MEAFVRIERERDEYREETEAQAIEISRLKTEIEVTTARLRARNEELEGTNAMLAAERDHYMRQVTELLTQFTALQSMISDGLEAARQDTYRPNGAVPRMRVFPPENTPEDEERLKRIAAMLAPPKHEQPAPHAGASHD